MHVPWGWIKQRPHFFAEYLAKDCIVDLFYKKPILVSKRSLLTPKPENSNLVIKGFRQIAFDKIPVFKYLNLHFFNDFALNLQLPDFSNYDYVWFTCPSIYPLFKNRISDRNKVIYDCMDDILEFSFCRNNNLLREKMILAERELMERSDQIFCSSDYLKDKISNRSGLKKNIVVLNNAIELPRSFSEELLPDHIHSICSLLEQYPYSLLYIGTISEWFDFDMLVKVLNRYEKLHLMLIGPSDVAIPSHPKIHYLGTVERTYIFSIMQKAWCLIMPFKINELIRSVNPVKLYEYIYAGKHIIAPEYGETVKFSKFVNLYKSERDFCDIIERILGIKKIDSDTLNNMRLFAENNTWYNRYQVVKQKINL